MNFKEKREQKKMEKDRAADDRNMVSKGQTILQEYKSSKQNLEARLVSNQQWFKLQHWPEIKGSANNSDDKPASAWLQNSLVSRHADAMDNFPAPSILPREANDVGEAQKLSSIVPLIMEQNDFVQTYSDCWWDKEICGTAVYGVFWDSSKLNGLGDITISQVDLLNIFWEPGITDIQKSANIFVVALVDTELLKSQYPDADISAGSAAEVKAYTYEDHVPVENKSAVIDWYYKRKVNGKTILHYAKYTGSTLLYSTENDEKLSQTGLYDHGLYPFVTDVVFPEKGSIAGFGHLDIMKSPQEYIDKLNQALLKNAIVNSKPRFFKRQDAQLNISDFTDTDKDIIEVSGNLSDESIRPVQTNQLPGIYVTLLNNKIEELKETSGNRDVANGGTTGGATAASAIAALQEASGKSSRDLIKSSYRAYTKIVLMVIELIRQFYDEPRTFRIMGEQGQTTFEAFDNSQLKAAQTGVIPGADGNPEELYRSPTFDIKVSAQKASVYSTLAQNELALNFFGRGFFAPQMSDQALACIQMMDFEGKEEVKRTIAQNGTLYQQNIQLQQQCLKLAQVVDMLQPGSGVADGIAQQVMGAEQGTPMQGTQQTVRSSQADKARERAAVTATPR